MKKLRRIAQVFFLMVLAGCASTTYSGKVESVEALKDGTQKVTFKAGKVVVVKKFLGRRFSQPTEFTIMTDEIRRGGDYMWLYEDGKETWLSTASDDSTRLYEGTVKTVEVRSKSTLIAFPDGQSYEVEGHSYVKPGEKVEIHKLVDGTVIAQ